MVAPKALILTRGQLIKQERVRCPEPNLIIHLKNSMLDWKNFCSNPASIEKLYGELPDFSCVEISRMSLNRDPSRFSITLLSSVTPKIIPSRWSGLPNYVAISLCFSTCNKITISGWSDLAQGEFSITPVSTEHLQFQFRSTTCEIDGTAESFQFERFDPVYLE